MSKKGKVIVIFFIGLLLMGIGSGISFAEYSSFHYGGKKNFSGEMTTVTLHKTLPEDADGVYLLLRRYDFGNVSVETDETMAKNELAIEVTCDENRISPFINEETEWPWELREASSDKVIFSLDYYYHGSYNDASDFFQIKDELLKDIKERMVYTYTTDQVQKVTVKVSPELADQVIIRR